MAAVDDEFDAYGDTPDSGRTQWLVNVAGALTSVALVLGVAVWGYKLAVRDVSGIPVVRALEGPMRIAPQEPGGEIAANVGLSVNEVAADGSAAALPEQMVLAPRPVDLSADDQPVGVAAAATGAAATATLASLQVAGGDVLAAPLVPVAPVEAITETPAASQVDTTALVPEVTPQAMESAVDSALAEALGADPASLAAADPAPPGAVLRSPRPERRPEGDGSAETTPILASVDAKATPSLAGEVDPATLAAGTRLVQLGAFDDEAGARSAWAGLQSRFGELIASKSLVLQTAESGGRSFIRLRALGFDDEADARRFCSALLAENASCIPVAHRP